MTLSAAVTPSSGSAVPTGTVNFYTGTTLIGSATLANGSATLVTTHLPVGSDSLSAQYGGDAFNAASTSAAITITILVPDFTMTTSPSAMTVKGGIAATTTINIAPENSFSQAVNFSCSGLPAGSTCTFGNAGPEQRWFVLGFVEHQHGCYHGSCC